MTATKHAAPPAVVVGTGFGCRVHVPSLRAAGFDVVGLVGTDAERTARRAEDCGIPLVFTDLDEAIRKTGAVAVTIATPPHTHAALALTALARGCHVICEKPMASSAGEARTMLEAAERAGVTHLMGNQFRWQAERIIVARALANGLIGEPRFLTLTNYMPHIAAPETKMPPWWFDQAAGGGWLGAHGSHIIDQVRTWLGEFASLSAALPIVSARDGVAEDSYVLRFRLTNGVQGVIQQTGGAWGPPATMMRVAGTHGTIWTENGVVHIADRSGVRELPAPADLTVPAAPGKPDDPAHRSTRNQSTHMDLAPYVRLCEMLRAGIEGRTPTSAAPPPTFHDGLACMEVLDAIRASAARDGALVTL